MLNTHLKYKSESLNINYGTSKMTAGNILIYKNTLIQESLCYKDNQEQLLVEGRNPEKQEGGKKPPQQRIRKSEGH